jgi:hypothetical protein
VIRLVIGVLLTLLGVAFVAGGFFVSIGSSREFAEGFMGMSFMTLLFVLPGLLLVHFGLKSRGKQPRAAWVPIVLGAVLLAAHAASARAIFAGHAQISSAHVVLVNTLTTFIATLLISFGIAALHSLDKPPVIYGVAPLLVTALVLTSELMVNNGNRDALVAQLQDRDAATRSNAAATLAQSGYRGGVPSMIAALRDPSADVRRNAAAALAASEAHDAVPAIAALLDDADITVQHAAIDALRKLRDRAAAPALSRVVDRNDGEQARSAQDTVRAAAASALAELPDAVAAPALNRTFERHDLAAVAGGHVYFIRKGAPGTSRRSSPR